MQFALAEPKPWAASLILTQFTPASSERKYPMPSMFAAAKSAGYPPVVFGAPRAIAHACETPEMVVKVAPESVEWMNAFLRVIWGLINPDMFVPIADVVEDVMQQSLPGFIDAVRISDIGQGTNPLRIISMRALPDQPGDKEYPREEWVGLSQEEIEKKRKEGAAKDEDQSGDYVNYEVAFSYQALPGQGKQLRQKNIQCVLIVAGVGEV